MKYDGNLYKFIKDELKLDETKIDYQKPPPIIFSLKSTNHLAFSLVSLV